MARQQLKFYILHDLYVVIMGSVVSGSKTSYLVISKISKTRRKKKYKRREKGYNEESPA